MKSTLFYSTLVWAVVSTAGAAVLDGIAAKVNDDVITIGEAMVELRRSGDAEARFKGASSQEEMKKLYDVALDQLIDRKLILASAAAKKMEIQEWVIDNRVREIVKDNFGGDKNKLEQELTNRRIPFAEWRNQIREDLILSAVRYQTIEKNAIATPGAMRAEYEKNKSRYALPTKATVSVILLKPATDAKTPSVSTRATEIFERLDAGDAFADLARRYSADSHAAEGGVWRDVDPEESFRPEIADAIAKLKTGQRSKLIDLDGWGFIVRKDAAASGGARTLAEAYDDVAAQVRADYCRVEYAAWMQRLRAAAFVKKYPLPAE